MTPTAQLASQDPAPLRMGAVRVADSLSIAGTLLAAPAWGGSAIPAGAATLAAAAQDPGAAPSASPVTEPTAEARAVVQDRLARSLAARARIVLQREIVFLGVLKNSKVLMNMALGLEPDALPARHLGHHVAPGAGGIDNDP